MAQFVSLLGPLGLDSTNCEGGASCTVLVEAAMPERGGTLRVGAGCADIAGCTPTDGPVPPGEGTHGVLDLYICC
jgi:hypothetical protein